MLDYRKVRIQARNVIIFPKVKLTLFTSPHCSPSKDAPKMVKAPSRITLQIAHIGLPHVQMLSVWPLPDCSHCLHYRPKLPRVCLPSYNIGSHTTNVIYVISQGYNPCVYNSSYAQVPIVLRYANLTKRAREVLTRKSTSARVGSTKSGAIAVGVGSGGWQ